MKFTRIRLHGPTYVNLPIVGATSDGPFVLKSADGLGPTEVDVRIAQTVLEGGVLQGRKANNRQIVLRIGLQPDWDIGQTAEELRTILYGMLTPRFGLPIQVEIMRDTEVVCEATGFASKFEVAFFTQDPEVQITIDCDHPYLQAPEIVYQVPETTVVDGRTAVVIQNEGTAPAGFWMSFVFDSDQTEELEIADNAGIVTNSKSMIFRGTWEAGDIFTLDTRPRTRGVWKEPVGSYRRSVLGMLRGYCPWLQLHGGDNTIMINNLDFNWRDPGFGHTPAYWGV